MALDALTVGLYREITEDPDAPWHTLDLEEKLKQVESIQGNHRSILLLADARNTSKSTLVSRILGKSDVTRRWLLFCLGLDSEKDMCAHQSLARRAIAVAYGTTTDLESAQRREESILRHGKSIQTNTDRSHSTKEQLECDRGMFRIALFHILRLHSVSKRRLMDSGMNAASAKNLTAESALFDKTSIGSRSPIINDALCHVPLSVGKRLAHWFLHLLKNPAGSLVNIHEENIREEIRRGYRGLRSLADIVYRAAGEPEDSNVLQTNIAEILEGMGIASRHPGARKLTRNILASREISGHRQTSIDSHY